VNNFFAAGGGSKVAILRIIASQQSACTVGERGAVFLISAKKRKISSAKVPEGFLRFGGRAAFWDAGGKNPQRNVQASGDLGEVSSEGTVWRFDARQVTTYEPRTALEVALRTGCVAPISNDHFPECTLGFSFGIVSPGEGVDYH